MFSSLKKSRYRKIIMPYLYLLPCIVVMLAMMVYPIIYVFELSFSSVKLPFFEKEFVGLQNFIRMVGKEEFGRVWLNTAIWTFLSIALRLVFGFIAALIMERGMRMLSTFRVIMLIPWIVPAIVSSHTWRWIYNADNGLLNTFIRIFNPEFSMNWLGNSKSALLSVIGTYVWMGFPFIMLMLVAGMQGIPSDFYEVARISGANYFQTFRYVTLPCLKNIIVVLIIMETISGFNSFDILYTMTAGGPGGASEILGLFIYRIAFSNLDLAGAASISVMLIIVMMICFIFYMIFSKKTETS